MEIGILHPGEMGAGVAGTLVSLGHRVWWVPEGRSAESAARAETAGIEPVGSLDELVRGCELILSICPPHAAVDLARQVAATSTRFSGVYLDANAVSPSTVAMVSSIVTDRGARYVDGGLIGSPPPQGHPRWYLSGPSAPWVAEQLVGVPFDLIVLGDSQSAASALKMAYASWTKGSAALLLAIRAMATRYGVDDDLLAEWQRSQPELPARCDQAASAALGKGWRWSGEMEQVAMTFGEINLPEGFGQAAAEVYKRVPRRSGTSDNEGMSVVTSDLFNERAGGPSLQAGDG